MSLTRRAALVGLAGSLAVPHLSRAAETGQRSFRVFRGDDDIGYQTNKVTRVGDTVTHEVEAELKVKILGITAYRYELAYTEEWKGGFLTRLDSVCNDDGTDEFAKVRRAGGKLEIDGSGHQGAIEGTAATTSYWAYPFLQRSTWISTQTGAPLTMTASQRGAEAIRTGAGSAEAEKWSMTGGYEVDLYFQNQEWVAVGFAAGDERAWYVPDDVAPAFMPVWNASL